MSITIQEKNEGSVVNKINKILCNYQIMYQNLNGLHWLIISPQFYTFHALYGDLYETYAGYIDIAGERIVQLDKIPFHTSQDFINNSTLSVIKDVSECYEGLTKLFSGVEALIREGKEIVKEAEEYGDIVTLDSFTKIVGEQEKCRWMLKATIEGLKKMMNK